MLLYGCISSRRVLETDRLNESLRRALGAKIIETTTTNTVYTTGKSNSSSSNTTETITTIGSIQSNSLRKLQPAYHLLCHTPHFLGPVDKAGMMNENNNLPPPPMISAYNTPGIF